MALGNKEIMARNIRHYMALKGINQTELCNALNLKYMTVSDWLHAKTYPRIDKIELMASFFGITKADLVEDYLNNQDNEQAQEWYDDPETAKMAQEIFEDPQLRILMDASRKLTPEDMTRLILIAEALKNGNGYPPD